jgi:hypothetical protein
MKYIISMNIAYKKENKLARKATARQTREDWPRASKPSTEAIRNDHETAIASICSAYLSKTFRLNWNETENSLKIHWRFNEKKKSVQWICEINEISFTEWKNENWKICRYKREKGQWAMGLWRQTIETRNLNPLL